MESRNPKQQRKGTADEAAMMFGVVANRAKKRGGHEVSPPAA